LKFVTQV